MIKELFETHLFVADIKRSIEFYKKVLGLKQCHYEDERRVVFFGLERTNNRYQGYGENQKRALIFVILHLKQILNGLEMNLLRI